MNPQRESRQLNGTGREPELRRPQNSSAITLREVLGRFPGWRIIDVTGGWVAFRVPLVSGDSGLSNVRCGATLAELAGNLQAESRLDKPRSPVTSN